MSNRGHYLGGSNIIRIAKGKSLGAERPKLRHATSEDELKYPGHDKISYRNLKGLRSSLFFQSYVKNCKAMSLAGQPWNPPPKPILKRFNGNLEAIKDAVLKDPLFNT